MARRDRGITPDVTLVVRPDATMMVGWDATMITGFTGPSDKFYCPWFTTVADALAANPTVADDCVRA